MAGIVAVSDAAAEDGDVVASVRKLLTMKKGKSAPKMQPLMTKLPESEVASVNGVPKPRW